MIYWIFTPFRALRDKQQHYPTTSDKPVGPIGAHAGGELPRWGLKRLTDTGSMQSLGPTVNDFEDRC